jgi:hypothetical protein
MSTKSLITLFLIIGSTIGSFIPGLWSAGMFSMWGIIFGALGGFAGIWLGFRLGNG